MTRKNVLRLAAALFLVACAVAAYESPLRQHLTVENMRTLAAQIASHWYSPFVFIATYAVASVLFIPASVFVIGAGVIWGWKLGGLYAIVGGTCGAMLSYWAARFIGGGILARFGEKGAQLGAQMQNARFSTLLLFRVVPVFPFPVVNYTAGAVCVRPMAFFLSSVIGLTPSAFVFAYIGEVLRFAPAAGSGVTQQELVTRMFIRLAIAGVALAALVLLPRFLKRPATVEEHSPAELHN